MKCADVFGVVSVDLLGVSQGDSIACFIGLFEVSQGDSIACFSRVGLFEVSQSV